MRLLVASLLIVLTGCTYNVTTGQTEQLTCSDVAGDSESIRSVPYHEYVIEQRPAAASRLISVMHETPRNWLLANTNSDPDSVDFLLRTFAEDCGLFSQATGKTPIEASLSSFKTTKKMRGLD